MENVCGDCKRRFNPDLRFCPFCGGEARPSKTTSWNYRETGLISHRSPADEEVVKAYRVNAFILLACSIVLAPFFLAAAWVFIDTLYWAPSELSSLLPTFAFIVLYGILVAATLWGLKGRRPGLQVAATGLLWFAVPFLVHPLALLFAGLVFSLLWGLGASNSGSFTSPDPDIMMVMSGLALLFVLGFIVWIFILGEALWFAVTMG